MSKNNESTPDLYQYTSRKYSVIAWRIVSVRVLLMNTEYFIDLENGERRYCDQRMCAYIVPKEGDYLVHFSDKREQLYTAAQFRDMFELDSIQAAPEKEDHTPQYAVFTSLSSTEADIYVSRIEGLTCLSCKSAKLEVKGIEPIEYGRKERIILRCPSCRTCYYATRQLWGVTDSKSQPVSISVEEVIQ